MEDSSAISSAIAEILNSSPSHQLVGARLQLELTQRFPKFRASNYECRNLLDFVRRHSTRVSVIGRSGGDVIYGLKDSVAQSSPSSTFAATPSHFKLERAPSTRTWRTFVSPNANHRIYANAETGEVKNLLLSAPGLEQPWIQIPSATPETHLRIAKEFLNQLENADHREQLAKTLEQPMWWQKFSGLARDFGVDAEWRSYRHSRLWIEFEKALESTGVSPAVVKAFCPTESPHPSKGVFPRNPASEELIRRIATFAIQNANISDLRKIWLPLGAVIDALENE